MKIVIVPNNNSQSREVAQRLINKLSVSGNEVVVPKNCKDDYPDVLHLEDCFDGAELCIVIGGDGAVLFGGKNAAIHGVPVLAINTGRVGFLTAPEDAVPDYIETAVKFMRREKRSMLDIEVINREGATCLSSTALNEAVIARGEISRIIEIALSVDGCKINTLRGDGVIISTPTGSTAYSMSAGGPIVAPDVSAIVVTPICPYTLAARAVVLSDKAELSAELFGLGERDAKLTIDGNDAFPLQEGMKVVVKRSDRVLELLMPDEASFNEKIKTKLFGIDNK